MVPKSGPGIRKNYTIDGPVANYDMAPTVLYALNKKRPVQWLGRPILEMFIKNVMVRSPTAPVLPPSPTEVATARDAAQLVIPPQLPLDAVDDQDALAKGWYGWFYVELNDDEEREQCLSQFQLQATWLWGQWDLASFLVGLGAGVGGCVLIFGGILTCVLKRRWRYQRLMPATKIG